MYGQALQDGGSLAFDIVPALPRDPSSRSTPEPQQYPLHVCPPVPGSDCSSAESRTTPPSEAIKGERLAPLATVNLRGWQRLAPLLVLLLTGEPV